MVGLEQKGQMPGTRRVGYIGLSDWMWQGQEQEELWRTSSECSGWVGDMGRGFQDEVS